MQKCIPTFKIKFPESLLENLNQKPTLILPSLTPTVPPSKLVILDEQGAAVLNQLVGPYQESTDINLTCVSSGGVPTPKVTWWREHALLDDSFMILPDGTVKNVLYLEKLSRGDLHSVSSTNGRKVKLVTAAQKFHRNQSRLNPAEPTLKR